MTAAPRDLTQKWEKMSRKQLIATLAEQYDDTAAAERAADGRLEEAVGLKDEVKALLARLDGSRKDFADLKARLLSAELANERLRGYLDRVKEDDIVREELVKIGEPGGEQQLTPKRKHAAMPGPNHYLMPGGEGSAQTFGIERPWRDAEASRPRRRNWVNY